MHEIHFVFDCCRNRNQIVRSYSEPTDNVSGTVVSRIRHEHNGISGCAVMYRPRTSFFKTKLYAVECRCGATESKHTARLLWVVSNQLRRYGDRLNLSQRHQATVFIPNQIRVVQRGEEDPNQTWNRRWRNNVLLRPGVPKDGHSSEVTHEVSRDIFNRSHRIR